MEPSNQAAPVAAPKRSRGRGFPCTIPACPRGPLKPFTRASHLERHRTVHELVDCRRACGDIPCESQRAWTTHYSDAAISDAWHSCHLELYPWCMHRVIYCLNQRMAQFWKLQRQHHQPHHHFFIQLATSRSLSSSRFDPPASIRIFCTTEERTGGSQSL